MSEETAASTETAAATATTDTITQSATPTGTEQTPQAAAAPAAGAPEAYDWKPADGGELPPAELTAELEPLARDLSMSQEQASKMLAKMVDARQQSEEARVQALTQAREGWAAEVKADPVLGGQNFDATMRSCNGVIARYAPEAKEFLETTGLGNHKVIVKMLHSFAKATAEDSFSTPPANHTEGRLSREQVFYGKKS